ncbi:MAG: alpha/beta hydrolase [Phycisphaerales bacterium]
MKNFLLAAAALLLVATGMAGCQEDLIATPYVMYGEPGRKIFDQIPPAARTPEVRVFYVTDRSAEPDSSRGQEYGYGRGKRTAFGTATVSLGDNVTWDELVADSTRPERKASYSPRITNIHEAGSFSPISDFMEAKDGRLARKPGAIADFNLEQDRMCQELLPWLENTDRKEVVVFIHGFNNTFDDAVLRLAQAWHFTGRKGVPIVYSWPAGSPGLLNYAHDRESGEFTTVHLKMLLTTLARCPQIERIHILSHSRGTDVAITALRELNAEIRGATGYGVIAKNLGLVPAPAAGAPEPRTAFDVLKIQTLVLAAPDIDSEVFTQRFIGENLLQCCNNLVVYFSAEDSALGLANWLFNGRTRLGDMHITDFTPQQRDALSQLSKVQLINCKLTGYSSHSYFTQHPSAVSDLFLVMVAERPPGAAYGRPLAIPFPGAWEMDDSYLRPEKTASTGETSGPP